MIMRRPSSRTTTRRNHLAEVTRNAQVKAVEVKEQAEEFRPANRGTRLTKQARWPP